MTNSFNTPALFHHLICVKGQPFRDQEFDGYVDVSKPVASVEKSIAAGLNGFPNIDLRHQGGVIPKLQSFKEVVREQGPVVRREIGGETANASFGHLDEVCSYSRVEHVRLILG